MPSDSYITTLTTSWLLPRILAGAIIGYLLRVVEHLIWWGGSPRADMPLRSVARFSLMILPQCVLFGVGLGALLLGVMGLYVSSPTILTVGVFAIPALMSFLAVDLRELLRRMTGIR
jgi:hypothetical protein